MDVTFSNKNIKRWKVIGPARWKIYFSGRRKEYIKDCEINK